MLKRVSAIMFAFVLAAVPLVVLAGVITIPITEVKAEMPIEALRVRATESRLRASFQPYTATLTMDCSVSGACEHDLLAPTGVLTHFPPPLTATFKIYLDLRNFNTRGRAQAVLDLSGLDGEAPPKGFYKSRIRGNYTCVGEAPNPCQEMEVNMTMSGRVTQRKGGGRSLGTLDLNLVGTLERNGQNARLTTLDGTGELLLRSK